MVWNWNWLRFGIIKWSHLAWRSVTVSRICLQEDVTAGLHCEMQTSCELREVSTFSLMTWMWFAAHQLKAGRTWSCERSSSSQREPLRSWPASATEVGGRDPLPEEPRPTDPRPARAAWFTQRPAPPRPRWAAPLACPSATTRFHAHFVSHSATLHSLITSLCFSCDFAKFPFVNPCLFCLHFYHDVPLFLRINTLPEIMISPGLQTANPAAL